MTIGEIRQTLDAIQYLDWTFHFSADAPGHWYLQVRFWALTPATHEPELQHGRKWLLSQHMTRSEIAQTALKAVLTAVEHEAREAFTYKAKAIFGPHMNVDFLAEYSDLPWTHESRVESPIHHEEEAA